MPVLATETKVVGWAKSPLGSQNERAGPDHQLCREIDGVEIEDIEVDGKSITIAESFGAEDDWLKDITFRVKNISGQCLSAVQITLVLPEIKVSPQIVFLRTGSVDERRKSLMPDEATPKMPDGAFYVWVKSRIVSERPLSQITKAEISAMYVTLPSGIIWFSRCVQTADPQNACPKPLAP